jgi:DNA repair protein RadC
MFGSVSLYEKELLAVFSKLAPETQDFILEMAQSLLKRQGELKERGRIVGSG